MEGHNEFLPAYMSDATSGRSLDVLEFSEDSNYIAEHLTDTGEVGMHFRLRYTSDLVSRQAEGVTTSVYSMAFSHDNELLVAAAADGLIRVWNVFSGRVLYERSQHPDTRIPIHYVTGTYNLLVAAGLDRLAVIDPTGMELSGMSAGSAMVDVRMLSDRRRVAILTEENRLELYRLEDGEYLGYVPSFNVTPMTSFDFNSDDTRLLMGHQDGSIYMVDLEANLVPPRRRPILRLIGEEETVAKGEEFTERIPAAEYADTEGVQHSPFEVVEVRYRGLFPDPWHSVDLLAGTTFLPDPFTMSLDVQLGYTNGFLLHPFYWGILWRSSWGFPRSDFPYIYHIGPVEYDPPLLVDWVLEVPVGLVFAPWDFGLEIYTEVAIGFAMHELWNRRLGGEAVTAGLNSSHFHGAFVAALTLGLGWKGAMLKASGEWDSEFGWTGQLSLGYSFRLPLPQRWRATEGHAGPVEAEMVEEAGREGERALDEGADWSREESAVATATADGGGERQQETAGGDSTEKEELP